MTDEERSEEYAKGKAHEHYHFLFEENNGSPVDFAKLCHLDGLSEGRKLGKEEQWKATEKAQKKTSERIRELGKENAELKLRLEKTNEDCAKETLDAMGIVSQRNLKIEQLEKENEELKEKVADLTAEREHHLNLMKGLNARIDSMKCCVNCKNWSDGDCIKGDTYLFYSADYKCDEWRLAE